MKLSSLEAERVSGEARQRRLEDNQKSILFIGLNIRISKIFMKLSKSNLLIIDSILGPVGGRKRVLRLARILLSGSRCTGNGSISL